MLSNNYNRTGQFTMLSNIYNRTGQFTMLSNNYNRTGQFTMLLSDYSGTGQFIVLPGGYNNRAVSMSRASDQTWRQRQRPVMAAGSVQNWRQRKTNVKDQTNTKHGGSVQNDRDLNPLQQFSPEEMSPPPPSKKNNFFFIESIPSQKAQKQTTTTTKTQNNIFTHVSRPAYVHWTSGNDRLGNKNIFRFALKAGTADVWRSDSAGTRVVGSCGGERWLAGG